MLRINEIFGPTIQGEGKSAGLEVMFLRLAFCNLHCIWCDTPYTWNWTRTKFKHPKKFDFVKEVHEMGYFEIISKLVFLNNKGIKSLVVSGGEPLLQQKDLIPLFQILKSFGWWIEIETNGTIIPSKELVEVTNQFNCSPKLKNSGNSCKSRLNIKALEFFANNPNSNFKFVVGSDKDSIEILNIIHVFNLKQVYLMPLGMTVDELNATRKTTQKLCDRYNLNYSERLHIVDLGGGRGV